MHSSSFASLVEGVGDVEDLIRRILQQDGDEEDLVVAEKERALLRPLQDDATNPLSLSEIKTIARRVKEAIARNDALEQQTEDDEFDSDLGVVPEMTSRCPDADEASEGAA